MKRSTVQHTTARRRMANRLTWCAVGTFGAYDAANAGLSVVAVLLALGVLIAVADIFRSLATNWRRTDDVVDDYVKHVIKQPDRRTLTLSVKDRYAANGELLNSGKVPGFYGAGDAVTNKWKRRQQAIADAVLVRPNWVDTHEYITTHEGTMQLEDSGKWLRIHSYPWR